MNITLRQKDWPHAPVHRIDSDGIYLITAATFNHQRLFTGPKRLNLVQDLLLSLSKAHNLQLEAWAVLTNHYHFVGRFKREACNLREFLKQMHANTAREINRLDNTPGRDVWQNFWDTKLTYQRSYLARLSYVHQNPVKHGIVQVANQYPWCSAAWFERTAPPAVVKTIYSFKTDQLRIEDDF